MNHLNILKPSNSHIRHKTHYVKLRKKIIFHFQLTLDYISDILVSHSYARTFGDTGTTMFMFMLFMIVYDKYYIIYKGFNVCVYSWLTIRNLTSLLGILLIGLDRTHCCACPDQKLSLTLCAVLSLYSVLEVRLNFFLPLFYRYYFSTYHDRKVVVYRSNIKSWTNITKCSGDRRGRDCMVVVYKYIH